MFSMIKNFFFRIAPVKTDNLNITESCFVDSIPTAISLREDIDNVDSDYVCGYIDDEEDEDDDKN